MTKKTIQRVSEHFPKIRFGGIHDPTTPNLFEKQKNIPAFFTVKWPWLQET